MSKASIENDNDNDDQSGIANIPSAPELPSAYEQYYTFSLNEIV